jgi:hypothetical protein
MLKTQQQMVSSQHKHWLQGRILFLFVFALVQCCTFAVAVHLMRQYLRVNRGMLE